MEQTKLFYNICNDLWSFAKKLRKTKSEMNDEDWEKAIAEMAKLTEKYKTLGDKEYDLANTMLLEILNYIQKG